MLKPFGLSIFFYKTKTILSTKNIRKYTHEYATSISQNTHICFAKYSHSNTKYIATNLQQHNIQKTKTILLQCKNPLFARQKPCFCTAKTPFLFFVSITNTLLMCYEYSVKWLRTFHKMPTKTHETPNKHPRNVQRNTPSGVGADSSCPYPYIIKYAFPFHHTRIFTLSNMRLHSTTTQRTHCYFGVNIKKGLHKWNPFNCKPSTITIANRLQQCHKHPRSIVFLQNTRASGALWF